MSKLQKRVDDLSFELATANRRIESLQSQLEQKQVLLGVAEAKIIKLRKIAAGARGGGGDAAATPGKNIAKTRSTWADVVAFASEQSLVPGVAEWEVRFFDPLAAEVKESVHSFIHTIASKPFSAKSKTMLQSYLSAMEHTLSRHALWRDCDTEELAESIDALEKYILSFPGIVDCLCAQTRESVRRDWCIAHQLQRLQVITAADLDLPPPALCHPIMVLAITELERLNAVVAPQEKVEVIYRCSVLISRLLADLGDGMNGADYFLPVFIYVIIKARPRRLFSTIDWVMSFRRPERLCGEREYYFTNFYSAVTYIENCSIKDVRGSLTLVRTPPHAPARASLRCCCFRAFFYLMRPLSSSHSFCSGERQ